MDFKTLIEYLSEIQAYASELEKLLGAECVEVSFVTEDTDKDFERFTAHFGLYIRKDGDNKFSRYFMEVEDLDKYLSDLVRIAKIAKGVNA